MFFNCDNIKITLNSLLLLKSKEFTQPNKGVIICLLITIAILFAGYNFYEHNLLTQAYMSFGFAIIPFTFFIYRLIKNRRCIFGDAKDCNKKNI